MPGRPLAFTVIGNIEVRLDNLISEGKVRPMILVFPDGRIDGNQLTDSEWANTPAGRFDSYVTDVVKDVDQRFGAIADREARDIAGLSAGAYGAINIALHHLDVFGNVQVWSGYFTETKTGVFAHATKADLAYNSPIDYVRTLRAALTLYPLRAFLFVGRDDRVEQPDRADGRRNEGRGGRRPLRDLRRRPRLAGLERPPRPDADPRLPRHGRPARAGGRLRARCGLQGPQGTQGR